MDCQLTLEVRADSLGISMTTKNIQVIIALQVPEKSTVNTTQFFMDII